MSLLNWIMIHNQKLKNPYLGKIVVGSKMLNKCRDALQSGPRQSPI